MKRRTLFFIGLTMLAILAFTDQPNSLVGQWQQKFRDVTVKTIYRTDGTFDTFINGKTFVSGKYKVSQDTFLTSGTGCGTDYNGTYHLTFLTPDSIQLMLIQDTCQGRRNAIKRLPTSSRIKPTKP